MIKYEILSQLLLALPFVAAFFLYMWAAASSNATYRKWSLYRTSSWTLGILCAVSSVAGPLAARAHMDFTAHMTGHLLLGMLAPLLMALGAPLTLLLRTLPVHAARKVSKLLKGRFVRFISSPVTASVLNVGGLWILYTTSLYGMMHHSFFVHVAVHIHVFLAGYLFTVSMISIDPSPHQKTFTHRASVLVLALAAHGILSKYVYAHPPMHVSAEGAQQGAMLMYYGGDLIDLCLIVLLCYEWFKRVQKVSLT
ncbi:cytochrome c oxidase assembly protein [Priestia megaterium]|jgi:putative membrane protein|uniref:Cytochrome c oxidase assembly protein n=1 Tax=Priestia megaterium TaxID=1404 RepID=A0A1I2UQA2_PRIMG|nr:cytochrome c oxidase assembly protein [Priestia megaterium]KLV31525.1 membrane protein [Priestia megaterium]MCE4088599.1 cytochrome c oxidase assembly protein [Priestia megaterium]QJX76708.1 cytochrome c oxidase assembly protein [Priestia megaterium]SFG79294.1 putative membrane protein [Priestia megaterium]